LSLEALRLADQPGLLSTGSVCLQDVATVAHRLLGARGIVASGFHLHLPEVEPGDRAAAGLAVLAALASASSGIEPRAGLGLVGCLSLTGRVGRVSHLAEKLLAAQRGGLSGLVLPAANAAELARLPAAIHEGLDLHWVQTVDEALLAVLPGLASQLNLIRVISILPSAS
ncbi:MAG: hypothetical protein KC910_14230, partial [Candidatus Eremiobacteraeota bacterium]|nr:hypothetical protein [Candidatus Eremiobacteraeota bacterium]